MSTLNTLREELSDGFKRVFDSSDVLRSLGELPIDSREELKRDLERLRQLVVRNREPRIVIVGKTDLSLTEVMSSIGAETGFEDVREKLGRGRWYEHESRRGGLLVADLRSEGEPNFKPLEYHPPDVVIAVARSEDEEVSGVADALVDAMDHVDDTWGFYPAGMVAVFRDGEGRSAGDFKTQQAFKDAFAERGLPRDWVDVVATARSGRLPRRLLLELPDEVRLTLARLSTDPETKRELAQDLIKIAASLNAAIATVPIPVAGVFPITSVQIATVAGIAYLSGREMNLRTLGEFAAALGLNVGAGFAFRELARALVQWIPVAGSVISASIAAGATLTLGNAAIRYFLDESNTNG